MTGIPHLIPLLRIPIVHARPIAVDLFAGGGGASYGYYMATGRHPDAAVNHDPYAVAVHTLNHPGTEHWCQDVWSVSPNWVTRGRPVGLLWASPDCTHHSRARGGKPKRSAKLRELAMVIVDKWLPEARPALMLLENVAEFEDWGPLDKDGNVIPGAAGNLFRFFVRKIRSFGYRVEWRPLRACDYGAPTTRERLYMIARCDGRPIVWPDPTHGDPTSRDVLSGKLLPWRTAAEIIDFGIPCPSIFDSAEEIKRLYGRRAKRPLAEATLRRIAKGVVRYVLEAEEPFVVGSSVPTMIQTGYGERQGQAPRVPGLDKPIGTVVASGGKHALVAAFLAKHYGGVVGHELTKPIGTVTGIDHHSLVCAYLSREFGMSVGTGCRAPLPTVMPGGGGKTALLTSSVSRVRDDAAEGRGRYREEVRAFLVKYYGEGGQWQKMSDPMHTIPTRDRMGLVTVNIHGEPYVMTDIGMRMLTPRELAAGQGFPPDYVLEHDTAGNPLPDHVQVKLVGNSVSPYPAAAMIRDNLPAEMMQEAAC